MDFSLSLDLISEISVVGDQDKITVSGLSSDGMTRISKDVFLRTRKRDRLATAGGFLGTLNKKTDALCIQQAQFLLRFANVQSSNYGKKLEVFIDSTKEMTSDELKAIGANRMAQARSNNWDIEIIEAQDDITSVYRRLMADLMDQESFAVIVDETERDDQIAQMSSDNREETAPSDVSEGSHGLETGYLKELQEHKEALEFRISELEAGEPPMVSGELASTRACLANLNREIKNPGSYGITWT